MPSSTQARQSQGRSLVNSSQSRTENPTLTILNSSNRSVNLALRRDNHVFAAQNDVQPGQSWTCTSSALSISAFTIDVREARGPHSSFVVGQSGDWSPRANDALLGVIGHGVGALALGALSLFGGRLSTAVRLGALAQAGNQALEAFEGGSNFERQVRYLFRSGLKTIRSSTRMDLREDKRGKFELLEITEEELQKKIQDECRMQ